MHFYTEHTNFGEETGRFSDGGENSFLVTSQFCLNDDMNAFACQRGIIIVLPCDNDCETDEDDELVTVILKPTDNLEISFRNVDYYVYRGILKSSILKSDTEIQVPNEKSTEWIDHIFSGRENREAFPACFVGYSKDYADDTTIDFVFSESNGMAVSEGEWFGIFSKNADMGFEIVTDSKMFPLTVGYAKQGCYSVKPFGTTDFERRMSRERILAFIDPVAFWGMHSEVGIHVVGQTRKLKGEELRTSILSLYGNKNRVYMDIRSEWGYSYNVYGNYSDALGNSIQLCTGQDNIIARRYETNGWPILYFDMEQNLNENFDHVTINLRINDNTKPILFVENAELLGKNNFSHFLDEKVLLNGAATDWSNDVVLKIPDSNWTYIKLQYFKQNNVANAVYSTEEMDTLQIFNISFASLDTKNLGNAAYIFSQAEDNNFPFIEGVLSDEKSFSGVAVAGSNFDTKRVVFHTRMMYPKETIRVFYMKTNSEINKGFDLEGSFNQMSFLKKNINCFAQSILENGASEPIKLLDISAYNGFPNRKEDLFVLGLTQDELFALKNVSGLSPLHPRYIGFDDVSPNPSKDVMGTYYRKYKLKVWGYDSNGECMETYPSTDIFVYTKSGHVFTSRDFSEQESPKQQINKKCPYCSAKFTMELICKTLNKKETSLTIQQRNNINSIIPYLNKYRDAYGLDTCLRKAHFIAQVAHETKEFKEFDESENFGSMILAKVKSRAFSKDPKTIDDIIVISLKEHLSSIFRFFDKNDKELVKNNDEIAGILLQEKPLIVDSELYGRYEAGKKLIKNVLNGNNLLYRIYIQNHSSFGVPLMSRSYALMLGNGNELTRDGWKFKGRGLFHLTGRANYNDFSGYRNSHPFLDDDEKIDFTKDGSNLWDGKYMKISSDAKYAVQSALWFWNYGNKYQKRNCKDYADIDDVESVSKTVNQYDRDSFPNRAIYYERAKQAFNIAFHKKFLEI